MNDINPANISIKNFVRQQLGCSCPDEVFESISITEDSDLFNSSNTLYRIGGRLLVAVLKPSDWHESESGLEQLIDAGKRLRNQQGYNRFRLVIATSDSAASKSLKAAFSSCASVDEKTHLHVIHPSALPSHEHVKTS